MAKILKKITGWASVYTINGQIHIVFVSAPNKKSAVRKLKKIEREVLDETQVRHVVVVMFPGPKVLQSLPESDWESKAFEIRKNE